MFKFLFKKEDKVTSDFSHFVREASSRDKKKVFMDVLTKATEDQKKILNYRK